MSLHTGIRLGAYEIVSLLGAGGMGEVYRARDTRLKREVAIKVLPDAFANDPERLARFQREAELLATLNHPNIGGIYGLEEGPAEAGHYRNAALVLELVEGPTLADRIAQGPIPVDEALPIAKQIAEALEAAHERGIVHRDLKPANIKLTPDGKVKVLDFGLAKAMEQAPGSGLQASSLSQSPTITSPAMTMGGVILGTAAYMSPEQARGKAIDKRTDVWAFGCVLFEMLTGRRVFEGDGVSDTLAAILRAEPDWTYLPNATPLAIRRLLRRCLNKDHKHRLADIADVRLELEEAVPSTSEIGPTTNNVGRRWVTAVVGLVIGSVIAGTCVWLVMRTSSPPAPATRRFALAEKEILTTGIDFQPSEHNLAISPDGSRVAYAAGDSGLYIRSLDRLGARDFPGLGRIRSPFFSPDGKWIAFFARGTNEIKKVSVTGGQPMTIATASGNPRGATWGSDGSIVFATFGERGLWTVSSDGGEPVILTRPAEGRPEGYVWPHFLPGTRAVLFAVARSPTSLAQAGTQIAVFDTDNGQLRTLLESGSHPQYLNSGHLLYSNGGSLFAVGFDASRLELRGEPVAVLDGVQSGTLGLSYASVANDGTLVFLQGGGETAANRTVVWIDRQGREETVIQELQSYGYPRVSPEGTRVAVHVETSTDSHILIHDLVRKTSMRLTFDKTGAIRPVWTPDGRSVLFRGEAEGLAIYRKASDGSGAVEKFAPLSGDGSATSFSPDARTLIFNSFGPSTNRDIFAMNLDDKKVRPLISEQGSQGNAVLSPNGRWLAYSDETEGYVVVTSFPDVTAGRWQISPPGSKWPLWSRDGRELFYVSGEPRKMMALPIEPSENAFKWGTPTALFPTPYFAFEGHTGARNYDLSPDGRRFVVIKNAERKNDVASVVVVENWFEELKRLVPLK